MTKDQVDELVLTDKGKGLLNLIRPGDVWRRVKEQSPEDASIETITRLAEIEYNRPIVFLDIDGVLINLKALREHPQQADPDCVDRLNAVTDEMAAVIVVSSTWRKGGLEKIAGILKEWGVTADVIGVTPDLSEERESGVSVATMRGAEIAAWLDENRPGRWPPFIIIDDDSDMGDLQLHLLQTDTYLGLTDEDVQRALALLSDLSKSNGGSDV